MTLHYFSFCAKVSIAYSHNIPLSAHDIFFLIVLHLRGLRGLMHIMKKIKLFREIYDSDRSTAERATYSNFAIESNHSEI